MHYLMKRVLEETTPRANPLMLKGVGRDEMKDPEKTLSLIMRSACDGLPEEVSFGGIQVCTPMEAHKFETRSKGSRSTAPASRSDLIVVRIIMIHEGSPIPPRHTYLPAVDDNGRFHLDGVLREVVPEMSDRVITGEKESGAIFLRLQQGKIRYRRLPYPIIKDGTICPVMVLHGKIHKTPVFLNRKTGPKTSIGVYVFIEKGLSNTLMGAGLKDWIVKDHVNDTEFMSGYISLHGKDIGGVVFFVKEDELNGLSEAYIASAIYASESDSNLTAENMMSRVSWMISLGSIIYKEKKGEISYLIDQMEQHMSSIKGYADPEVLSSLSSLASSEPEIYGKIKYVTSFCELQEFLVENACSIISKTEDGVGNMFTKSLEVKYSFFYRFISQANVFRFFLIAKKAKKGEITEADITSRLSQSISELLIYSVAKTSKSIKVHSSPGDSNYLGGTIRATSSTDVSGPNDRSLVYDASQSAIGNSSWASKSMLRICLSMNPYAVLGKDYNVVLHDGIRDDIKDLDRRTRRIE